MNVTDITKEIHLRSPVKKPILPYTADRVLTTFFIIVKQSVASGHEVVLPYFGVFSSTNIKPVRWLNPNKHLVKYSPAKRIPTFHFFKTQAQQCKR